VTLKRQSWCATLVLAAGLLGLVLSFMVRPPDPPPARLGLTPAKVARLNTIASVLMWPSAALIAGGLVGLVIVVRRASAEIARQEAQVDAILSDAARLQERKPPQG